MNSSQKRILVIDDDKTIREICEAALTQAGYVVGKAANVGEAMNQLNHTRPDMILMDICMPGVDGIRATRMFKADLRLRTIPIVIVTGEQKPDLLKQGEQYGAEKIILKPFRLDELIAVVQSILDPQSTEAHVPEPSNDDPS